jgi:hypothetical protein
MGKKTKNEKEKIEYHLNLQMNLPGDIARRNPKIRSLMSRRHWKEVLKDGDSGFSKEEYDKLVKATYGEVFPQFVFPVWRLDKLEEEPFELVLKIDLNYTKDEIMYVIEKFVSSEVDKYRKNHKVKIKRKQLEKWIEYLEIWDLKSGYRPPPKRNTASRLNAISFRDFKKKGQPWTYEQIAKYIYPDTTTPEKLESAIDKVKKQYRAAYNLICGEKYNSHKAKKQIDQLRQQNKIVTCDSCPDKPHCITLCPPMLEDVAGVEIKQQHHLVGSSKSTDLENFKKSSRKLPADKQFK